MRWKLLLLTFMLLTAVPVHGQEENLNPCDEAWLAHSWPRVAIQCSQSAFHRASDIGTRQAEAQVVIDQEILLADNSSISGSVQNDRYNLLPLQKSLVQSIFYLAAVEEARSAIAYHLLHRHGQAMTELGMAKYYIGTALEFADPEEQERSGALGRLLNDPKLFKIDPDKITLLQ